MKNPVPHIIANNHFWISPDRCLFWEEQNSLIVADLHLGKTGHFRKSGIAVPQSIYKADLQRLMAQLYLFKVDRLIIVGDFTHSTVNKELELFLKWRNDFSLLHIDLVKGNHDILSDTWYHDANIKVHEWELLIDGFCFRHEDKRYKKNESADIKYTFTAPIHAILYWLHDTSCRLKYHDYLLPNQYVIRKNHFAILEKAPILY